MRHKHPIKAVALRTGLSPHVIRIWERRYRAVRPQRTSTNRRIYSDEDINRLLLLKQAVEAGESIGQVAKLSDAELRELANMTEETPWPAAAANKNQDKDVRAEDYLKKCLKATMEMDSDSLERILLRASSDLSQPVLLAQVLEPLMYHIGEFWREGKLRVLHEHMASAIMRSFLGNMAGANKPSESAPGLIVTTPVGQNHEFGALMAAITAFAAGWKAIYLGPNIPAEEISNAAERIQANAVALSIIYPGDDPRLPSELSKLRSLLDDRIAIIVGGRSKDGYADVLAEIGAITVDNLTELNSQLEIIRTSKGNMGLKE